MMLSAETLDEVSTKVRRTMVFFIDRHLDPGGKCNSGDIG
jgi:hypothetical protein